MFQSSAAATKAEAPPPKPFKRATICGIPVIGYLTAIVAPMAAPMPPATSSIPIDQPAPFDTASRIGSSKNAAAIAIAMPMAPRNMPRTAVRGPPIILNATMKSIEAIR